MSPVYQMPQNNCALNLVLTYFTSSSISARKMSATVNLSLAVLSRESKRTFTRIPALTGVCTRATIFARLMISAIIEVWQKTILWISLMIIINILMLTKSDVKKIKFMFIFWMIALLLLSYFVMHSSLGWTIFWCLRSYISDC